ncbi:MAG: hypothetical protein AAF211_20910 [Myxococcota bacterium]
MTIVHLAWLITSTSEAQPAPEPVSPADSFVGNWQMDWTRSKGMEELMKAQGIPGFLVRLFSGARIQQAFTVSGLEWTVDKRLPIGKVQESWIIDGVARPMKSRRGNHELTATWTAPDELTVVRTFEDQVVTERYRVVDAGLEVNVELNGKGETHAAIQRFRRVD